MKYYVNPEMQMLSLSACDIVTTSSNYGYKEDGEGDVVYDGKDL